MSPRGALTLLAACTAAVSCVPAAASGADLADSAVPIAPTAALKDLPMVSPTDRQDHAALEVIFRELYRAMLAGDVAGLDALLAPGYTLTHITGYEQPRSEWLTDVANGRMRYHSAREVSLRVQVDGERANAVGRHVVDATIWGGRGTWNLQLATDFERAGDRWLAARTVATLFR
ncbi:nuclear transport factor 2 family protein [Burkholderia multivorans]|uniref:nuclear transport factor 2 family protein n=1 Tax=Burkholderia multivorans TaxID=87883 RepID=UPI0021C24597|nr:nuclear transport factor 2 family protein [Burkholderia multivorans]